MSNVHRAAWVLPIAAPPIRDGWVEIHDGRIVAVGGPGASPNASSRPEAAHDVAILPGLVNVHTHLELSWMAGRVPPSDSMGRWIRALMAARRSELPGVAEQQQAAAAALATARATGTVALGDIGNSFVAVDVLADAAMPAVLFHELIGFGLGPDGARARANEGASSGHRRGQIASEAGPRAACAVLGVAGSLSRDIRRGLVERPSVVRASGRVAGRSRVSDDRAGRDRRDAQAPGRVERCVARFRGAIRPNISIVSVCCGRACLRFTARSWRLQRCRALLTAAASSSAVRAATGGSEPAILRSILSTSRAPP